MKELKLLSEQPIGIDGSSAPDNLKFGYYTEVLKEVILHTSGPFTIGVYGEWGMGKSSLMHLIRNKLLEHQNIIPIWFDAWIYKDDPEPIIPLLEVMENELGTARFAKNKEIRNLSQQLSALKDFFIAGALKMIPTDQGAKAALMYGALLGLHHLQKFTSENNRKKNKGNPRSKTMDIEKTLRGIRLGEGEKVVVIIDDLDRCFPDSVVRLLEKIKMIFRQKGFIFLMSIATEGIEQYLDNTYGKKYGIENFQGKKYLEKIIQLPFPIPPHDERMDSFYEYLIKQLHPDIQEDFFKMKSIAISVTEENPRTLIRFINNLLIDLAIFGQISEGRSKIDLKYFAVSRGLRQYAPLVYKAIWDNQSLAERILRGIQNKPQKQGRIPTKIRDPLKDINSRLHSDPKLKQIFYSKGGQDWLTELEPRRAIEKFLSTNREFRNKSLEIRSKLILIAPKELKNFKLRIRKLLGDEEIKYEHQSSMEGLIQEEVIREYKFCFLLSPQYYDQQELNRFLPSSFLDFHGSSLFEHLYFIHFSDDPLLDPPPSLELYKMVRIPTDSEGKTLKKRLVNFLNWARS